MDRITASLSEAITTLLIVGFVLLYLRDHGPAAPAYDRSGPTP